jgi:hypothetical protein
MKPTKLLAVLSLFGVFNAIAALELPIVDYRLADNSELWKKAKADEVPAPLIAMNRTNRPNNSYSSLFPKSFLQESMFTVCYQNCSNNDLFKVKNGSVTTLDYRGNHQWNVIEQTNVYFWLASYFRFLDERFYFKPDQYLKVFTNRDIKDESNKKMRNNAFFNPQDVSLSFLPASKNLLFKLLGGKINRSGLDPSVVAHEASHYFFHHLFPNAVNQEIGGLNEGFADYVANILLQNPKVGLVMLQGKTLRDSSSVLDGKGNMKVYAPNMEVHDLGERVSLALWKSRELSLDKNEFDRMVVDAVVELSENPYATIHDFKVLMMKRLSSVISAQRLSLAEANFELIFPGNPVKVDNLSFMLKPIRAESFIGFKIRQDIPTKLAEEMGVPASDAFNFTIIKMEKVSATQTAILVADETKTTTTPYWVVLDNTRGNILGIYDLSRKLVKNPDELEKLEKLITQVKNSAEFVKDFTGKLKSFTDLHNGKGDFNIAYRVNRKSVNQVPLTFNGREETAQRIDMELKRRVLTLILGIPDITHVSLYTMPNLNLTSLPEIEGQKVIGYKLQLANGTLMEVILDKLN